MTTSEPSEPASPPLPPPDDKDWTWTLERPCPECGFDAAMVEPVAIPALVRDAVSRWADVLARPEATRRPSPTTWSPLEYACHVRDVCTLFTERLRLMVEEDDPTFANWDQDETALDDRYWTQDPEVVGEQLADAGETLAVAYTRVGDGQWNRTGIRSNGSEFTVESLGRYLLHDLFHHVWDVQG
ncbi:DinB family protein [Lapillicoccus sp.]|uniref:DinB family protein n=1 Tax=Lapillicoccus sp. TaxID=1909287 RepID=UPI00326591AE